MRCRELWVHPTLATVSAPELGCLRRESVRAEAVHSIRKGRARTPGCLPVPKAEVIRSWGPAASHRAASQRSRVCGDSVGDTLPGWDTLMVGVYPELPELEPVPQVTPSSAPSCLLHLPSQVWALMHLQLQ